MIEIKKLLFHYPRSTFQLRIEALQFQTGSRIAIVGPSGSGKTTLLNLLAGILEPAAGSIAIDGVTVSSLSESDRRDFRIAKIGMVFQQFELVEYLSATDNILLPYFINPSLDWPVGIKSAVGSLAQQMGIADKLRSYPSQLSQGEQQRVAICRALIARPKVILADEPTGNLDPSNKNKILELLFDGTAAREQTLIVVTHDVNILEGFDAVVDFEQFRHRSVV